MSKTKQVFVPGEDGQPGHWEDAPADLKVVQPPAEREPALRKTLHYKGNNVDELKRRYYFGPTMTRDGSPGRVWKLRHAEYDEATDVTTAWYAPVAEYELNAVIAEVQRRLANG